MNASTALTRRSLVAALALSAAGLPAWAQPSSTIRILVGFPPGGGTDAIAIDHGNRFGELHGGRWCCSTRRGRFPAGAEQQAEDDGERLNTAHGFSPAGGQ